MPKKKNSKGSDYIVGYSRPPKETQFKPGESGNNKGRQKGSRSVGALLQDVIRQKVSVTENGKTRRVATLEVVLRRLANDAMRSDPRAIKLLISLVDRYGESPETTLKLREMLAEDEVILAQYLRDPANLDPPSTCNEEEDDNGI